MQKGDRSLKFIEVNVPRLMELRQIAKTIKDQTGKTYMDYLIPAKDLLSFSSYFEANTYAQKTWGKPGLGMPLLYEQGWAFTYFLNHYDGGKYRDNWLKYFDSVFHRQVSRQTNLAVWKRAFGIKYEDEWKPLEADWEKYFKEVILPMSEDLSKWSYTPPTREDPWPDEANEKNQENVRRETVPVIGREHEAPTPAR